MLSHCSHSLAFSGILTFSCFLSRIPCSLFSFLLPAVTNSTFLNFSICDIFTAFSSPSHSRSRSHSHFYCAKCPAAQFAAQQQRRTPAAYFNLINCRCFSRYWLHFFLFPIATAIAIVILIAIVAVVVIVLIVVAVILWLFHSLKYLFIYCCSQKNNRAICRSWGSVIAEFKWVRSASAHESDYQHCNKCFEIVNKEKVLKNRILKLLLVGCIIVRL